MGRLQTVAVAVAMQPGVGGLVGAPVGLGAAMAVAVQQQQRRRGVGEAAEGGSNNESSASESASKMDVSKKAWDFSLGVEWTLRTKEDLLQGVGLGPLTD